jgi:hypothetical protein
MNPCLFPKQSQNCRLFLCDLTNESPIMTDSLTIKPSKIPANAVLLLIFLIVSIVLKVVAGPVGLIGLVVVVVWGAKVLIDLVRWLRADKETRPKMTFPKKTVLALLVVLIAIGYFAYLVARDLAAP